MPPTCSICRHEKRLAIDKALASGTTLRTIADRYRTSKTALIRHKSHVGGAIAKAAEKREESIGGAVLDRLEDLFRRGQKILDTAEENRDAKTALRAIAELRGLLAGLHQIAVEAAQAQPVQTNAARCPDCQREYNRDVRQSLGFIDADAEPVAALPGAEE